MKAIDLLKKEMIKGITEVLSGNKKIFKARNINPNMIKEYLESKGWETGELDTNGWDYDWWLHFSKDGKTFTAFGGGYYGHFEFRERETP